MSPPQQEAVIQERILSQRLYLNRPQVVDVPFLHFCVADPQAHGSYLSAHQLTLQEVEVRFQNGFFWNEHSTTFLIKLKKDHSRIGMIHCWDKPEDPSTAMYAVQIALVDYRNLGYGTEAQRAVIGALFRQHHRKVVEVYTDMQNSAEAHTLKKLGFQLEESTSYLDLDVQRNGNVFRLRREVYCQMEAYFE